jgi:N-acetylglucosamine kinase
MTYFLGVDGGQSGTAAVIGNDSGLVLGAGEAGPCNQAGSVGASVAAACRQAGLDSAAVEFESACFGLSGGPEDKEAMLRSAVHVKQLTVSTDAVIALAGATETGRGIITIAGTGSIAFGRNAEGRTARVGGWGYVYGDEGGAFDIFRQALRAALRMDEGWGTHTQLRAAILDATGARDANHAVHLMYTAEWPRDKAARLAPLVDAAAEAGDSVAREILNTAARQLALLAGAVRSQLWKPGEAVEIAYVGGVFGSRTVLERFRMLVELEDGVRCIAPRYGPAEGALLEAYRSAGIWPVTLHYGD